MDRSPGHIYDKNELYDRGEEGKGKTIWREVDLYLSSDSKTKRSFDREFVGVGARTQTTRRLHEEVMVFDWSRVGIQGRKVNRRMVCYRSILSIHIQSDKLCRVQVLPELSIGYLLIYFPLCPLTWFQVLTQTILTEIVRSTSTQS